MKTTSAHRIRPPRLATLFILSLAALLYLQSNQPSFASADQAPTTQPAQNNQNQIHAARWLYSDSNKPICFSDRFLALVARQTNIQVNPHFTPVQLANDQIYKHPFTVMTGQGAFTLSDTQRTNLKNYLTQGGFILASAGCSNAPWAASFQQQIKQIFPDEPLTPLKLDHPIFTNNLYAIDRIMTMRQAPEPYLYTLQLNGRIAILFSPLGLNDSANAGKNCCCCGGNEIRNAPYINANALMYALTH